MKRFFYFVVCVLALAGCNEEKKQPMVDLSQTDKSDSLQMIIDQRENEINDLMATFNEIQEGFRLIAEAEDHVTIAKDGEGADKTKQIKDNIQFIQKKMAENRELIEKMRQQLRESSIKGDELKKTIEALVTQLEDKDLRLQQLRAELNAKDIHITELDQAITTLNNDVAELKNESSQKSQTINEQDKQLHMAYYVFGTKSELKEQNILEKGEVLKKNFNKNYFTKIDTRVDKEIKLYAKSAKVMTPHPASSYTLSPDATKQYVLRINNPDLFWSTSKYLVVLVK